MKLTIKINPYCANFKNLLKNLFLSINEMSQGSLIKKYNGKSKFCKNTQNLICIINDSSKQDKFYYRNWNKTCFRFLLFSKACNR